MDRIIPTARGGDDFLGPTLMLNGEFDNLGPLETSVKPFFALLGTPAEDKRHVIAAGGHFVPRDILIRETLDWLDNYQGVPGSQGAHPP